MSFSQFDHLIILHLKIILQYTRRAGDVGPYRINGDLLKIQG